MKQGKKKGGRKGDVIYLTSLGREKGGGGGIFSKRAVEEGGVVLVLKND